MADMRLDDKTVWVTGAGKGLGRAIAVALSEAGANVAVTARTAADLEELESELTGKALVLPGSVADSTAVRTMVERITEWTDRLDAVVNCAGSVPTSPAASASPSRTGNTSSTSTSKAPSTARLLPHRPQLRPAGQQVGRTDRTEHSPRPDRLVTVSRT